jgi:hypothetical protein
MSALPSPFALALAFEIWKEEVARGTPTSQSVTELAQKIDAALRDKEGAK